MAVDLRQVMAAFLTFSMFVMLGNMIKKDHIDPLLGPLPESPMVQYGELKVSKPAMLKLSEINYGPWLEQDEAVRPCSKKPTLKGKEQFDGYVFFSLTHGPEYHASQIANAIVVARQLGATLALPDIRGDKVGDKMNFGEVYNVDKFLASLGGVVRVEKNPPAELLDERLPIVRVPNRASEDYISSKIKPIFQSKRNIKIVTYFNSSAKMKGQVNHQPNAYQCLAVFESLKLQPGLQELADSMVGTLRSLSTKMHGRFVAIDLRVETIGNKSCQETDVLSKKCFRAQEIGDFLKRIGFDTSTTIYLTHTGWHSSLNALRDIFPNSFVKDAIMPADEKAKFMDLRSRGYERYIDFYMCTQGDVFVPAFPNKFYGSVVGKRIGLGKTQIFLPAKKTSESASDYISPYIAKKSHFAYSCLC
ncbi:uncharacterized protein at1g04910 [Phtheirospermum japonicum]|uniref:O-fucosyltransferase family protein n=1 Tax=Phtheirospermum japonicum TaxID=374723 RepID=A0A830BYC1_9LAMI|nr:uncharacterized protein at1g04910 [Phtheirospermum japonicum]